MSWTAVLFYLHGHYYKGNRLFKWKRLSKGQRVLNDGRILNYGRSGMKIIEKTSFYVYLTGAKAKEYQLVSKLLQEFKQAVKYKTLNSQGSSHIFDLKVALRESRHQWGCINNHWGR